MSPSRETGRGRGRAAKTLDRVLSRGGLCSRSAARELIAAGRVRVDGSVVRDPARWVDPEREHVLVDGRALDPARPLYLALHKPKGYLTSFGDPDGRPTIYDLLADVPGWVAPVGRLDRDTSGLLLLTNDTAFANRVTDPVCKVQKTYRVRTKLPIDTDALDALRCGVVLRDGPTLPAEVVLQRSYRGYSLVQITLVEGRNRQVRRMFAAVGAPVRELARTRIGPVPLEGLASGSLRALRAEELSALAENAERGAD